ncbi:EIF4A1 isoform 32 [Pongo abelii]|uniref:EIF4A1 isoform 32 n=1 Tax=Pongo abelii TaxID=9601 RepID=A0A2J8RWR5_PONAB|nr:EIF4A1 isoform 32 [Pongo abelii]
MSASQDSRTEPNPEERPREAPGAHPAPGGRVHFAAQAGLLANCGWAGPPSFGGERPEIQRQWPRWDGARRRYRVTGMRLLTALMT